MSSILTNNGAMIALQTLKGINSNLARTQNEISTGKSVASAKDNAAIWAISKVMESDVAGFKEISNSLSLGQSTVTVARNAAESVTDLLTDIKGKIVAAQEENVDRAKIQTDIRALTDQIKSVVGAAQFNGLNLIDGSSDEVMKVLSSLDRSSSGAVTPSHIAVDRQNLSVTEPTTSASFGTVDYTAQADANATFQAGTADTVMDDTAFDPASPAATIANGASLAFTVGQVAAGTSYEIILNNVEVNVQGGGSTAGQRTFSYVASATDGTADVARNLTSQINAFFGAATNSSQGYSVAQGTGANANQFTITNAAGGSATAIGVQARVQSGGTPGTSPSAGGLGALQNINVETNATGALGVIDQLIEKSIAAATAFGSAQGRIETQTDFVGKLTDSLKSGIGSLVDADMEEVSARLQALQVQQQLATQSLSIANQAPQSLLSLFRG